MNQGTENKSILTQKIYITVKRIWPSSLLLENSIAQSIENILPLNIMVENPYVPNKNVPMNKSFYIILEHIIITSVLTSCFNLVIAYDKKTFVLGE